MKEIAHNIFIDESYPGVVLGAIKFNHRLLLVDAPFRVEDQQAWRAELNHLGWGVERILVMLDTHIDRTLGIRAMEANVLGHRNAVQILLDRPTTARGQDIDAGADWEPYDLPSNIQWAAPDMTYSDEVYLYWDDQPVVVSHQPGAHFAGSWLRYDPEKIIFVGDSVILNQPPFLGWSDLDLWLTELRWLASDAFKGYTIISGRNGIVRSKSIQKMIGLLTKVKNVVANLDGTDNLVDEIVEAVPPLLKSFSFNKGLREIYKNRLVWGLLQYVQRHLPESD